MADVLVVGAGLAAARTCALLREAGHRGTIEVVGAEPELPYDRPPLSKHPDVDPDLRSVMGLDIGAVADRVELGAAAVGLSGGDPDAGAASSVPALRVACDDGRVRRARAVVVATGARPVLPEAWARAGVLVLRTRADARQLWQRAAAGRHLVVVGGGWVGCEVAATAAARGVAVHLVEAAGQLLREVPAGAAARVRGWLREAGVEVHLGDPVTEVRAEGDSVLVRVGPRELGADVVLAGLGARPDTGWLEGAAVARDASGGVLVDGWGRSGWPGVLAVGDAAARWSGRVGRAVVSGHWTEAMQAPSALAPALAQWLDGRLGWTQAPAGPAWDPVAYVFSDIGAHTVQVVGDAARGEEVWREDERGWTCFAVLGQALVGVCGSGRPRDVVAARRAMAAHPQGRPPVDRAALADPGAPVARWFPPARGA